MAVYELGDVASLFPNGLSDLKFINKRNMAGRSTDIGGKQVILIAENTRQWESVLDE